MEYSAPDIAPASGLMHKRMSMAHFDLIRIAPSEKLRLFVENYWIVLWDLTGKPDFVQENLPHPSVNMVIDPQGQTGIFGVRTGRFSYRLSGSGKLFGAKFRPGAFAPFYDRAVSGLTDRHVAVSEVFGVSDVELEAQLLSLNDPASMGNVVEKLLLEHGPALDSRAREAGELVEMISANGDILRVEHLARLAGASVRSIQRLFEEKVGVGAKWVIERYRMLAAVDALNLGELESLTALSHDLGYFDQAHFSRSFRALTGTSPSAYLNVKPDAAKIT